MGSYMPTWRRFTKVSSIRSSWWTHPLFVTGRLYLNSTNPRPPTNCQYDRIHQACKSPKYFCSSMEGGRRIDWMLEKWKVVVCAHREQPLSRGHLCTTLATIASLHLSHVTGEYVTFVMTRMPCSFVLWFAKPLWHGKEVVVLVNCGSILGGPN